MAVRDHRPYTGTAVLCPNRVQFVAMTTSFISGSEDRTVSAQPEKNAGDRTLTVWTKVREWDMGRRRRASSGGVFTTIIPRRNSVDRIVRRAAHVRL
jgi:hypothetical protein